MSSPFTWFDLLTGEPDTARTFYQKLLGWDAKTMPMGDSPYTLFDSGAQPFAGLKKAEGGARWLVYLRVSNLEDSVKEAKSLGAQVVQAPTPGPAGAFSIITDPTGAPVALWQAKS